jgi:hypothetical protein
MYDKLTYLDYSNKLSNKSLFDVSEVSFIKKIVKDFNITGSTKYRFRKSRHEIILSGERKENSLYRYIIINRVGEEWYLISQEVGFKNYNYYYCDQTDGLKQCLIDIL